VIEPSSTRPYLLRAIHEWCADNGFTPYVAVQVDDSVQVPRDYVKNGEIVLNISYDATNALSLGNEFIEFKARFGGVPRDIVIPVARVIAIYARENGQGMAFTAPPSPTDVPARAGPVLTTVARREKNGDQLGSGRENKAPEDVLDATPATVDSDGAAKGGLLAPSPVGGREGAEHVDQGRDTASGRIADAEASSAGVDERGPTHSEHGRRGTVHRGLSAVPGGAVHGASVPGSGSDAGNQTLGDGLSPPNTDGDQPVHPAPSTADDPVPPRGGKKPSLTRVK
jgi:stringent starvation protein B